jgi:hypothetical protein
MSSPRIDALLITPPGEERVSHRVEDLELAWEGVVGDVHFGTTRRSDSRRHEYPRGTEIRNERQVTIVSPVELAEIARRLGVPYIEPEWLGANMLVSGIEHLTATPSTAVFIAPSGAALMIMRANGPCRGPGNVIQSHYPEIPHLAERFAKEAVGLRGLTAVVERPGVLHAGDSLTVYSR